MPGGTNAEARTGGSPLADLCFSLLQCLERSVYWFGKTQKHTGPSESQYSASLLLTDSTTPDNAALSDPRTSIEDTYTASGKYVAFCQDLFVVAIV